MFTKTTIHNRLLSSSIIFSFPFLLFAGFFEESSEYKGNQFSVALPETPSLALTKTPSVASPETPSLISKKVPLLNLIAPGTKIGTWVWQRQCVVDPWERALMLDFCRSHGINCLFVQVHFDRTEYGDYVLADQESWNDLLSAANDLGIRIEALDGAGDMAFSVNHADGIDRLKAVLDFNRSQPLNARFSGIHYDIEPYTTSRWRSGEHREVALELLELLSKLRQIVSEADPSLSFANDIPFWYDSDEKFLIEFNGAEKYLNEHIQDISDFIGIMSYRTNMTGENSTSEISSGELDYGAKIGRPVYLSLETVELADTPQITFFGKSPEVVALAVRELSAALKDDSSFGGVFLHEYTGLRLLGDPWDLSSINF